MSTSYLLPLKCLQITIRHLARESDTHTLSVLLCVNKYVCSATLPFLYKSPFLAVHEIYDPIARAEKVLLKLARTVLLSFPESFITDMLRAAYFPDQQEEEQPLRIFIPYYKFITNVIFETIPRTDIMVFYNDTLSSRPEFIKHLNYCHVHDRLAADQLVGHFFDETPRDVDHAACRELQRDISWALCADTERVQSLVIPISDISRYLALIPRLKVLSSITFYLDENFEHYLDLEGDDELTSQEQETLVRRQEDRTQHLEDIVRFVQEHRQFHPHILAVATCPGCQEEEYQFRLLECLPPLRSPLSLNSISWIHFVAKLQDTDLSFVQSISPPAISISDRFCKQSPFLNRCRSLDIINITSWGDDLFQWAIDERKAFNAEVAVGRTPDRPLVPLRDVSINYRNLSYGNQVDDITFGFGKTLESLVIVGHFPRIMNAHLHQEDFTFGNRHSPRSWNLPNLYRLSVDIHYIFLRIDPYFLALSPNLVTCTSKDKRTTYSIDEVECWFPADLPRLTHLILVGTPAISLDLDTLRTTPNLNHLELLLESTIGNIFIPPSEALDYIGSIGTASSTTTELPPSASSSSSSTLPLPRRPVWTWDWELPKLSTITLNSVFAYQFQFRMLQKTPSLASLSLDIKSTTNEHQRYIISEDFFSHTPPKSYWDYHDDWKDLDFEDNNDYIHLETLFLNGYWTTSDLVLSVLFRKVAPNIAGLSMVGDCCGFSLWGWVEMTSRHLPWLSEANSSYGWDPESFEEVGLVASQGSWGQECFHLAKRPEGRMLEKPADFVFVE